MLLKKRKSDLKEMMALPSSVGLLGLGGGSQGTQLRLADLNLMLSGNAEVAV